MKFNHEVLIRMTGALFLSVAIQGMLHPGVYADAYISGLGWTCRGATAQNNWVVEVTFLGPLQEAETPYYRLRVLSGLKSDHASINPSMNVITASDPIHAVETTQDLFFSSGSANGQGSSSLRIEKMTESDQNLPAELKVSGVRESIGVLCNRSRSR